MLAPWLELDGAAEQLAAFSELAQLDLARLGTTAGAEEIKDTAVTQPLIVALGLIAASRLDFGDIVTAGHDLKGPLTSIRGHSQLLLRGLRSPEPDLACLARGLAVIDAQAVAMTRLLDYLLDATRTYDAALARFRPFCERVSTYYLVDRYPETGVVEPDTAQILGDLNEAQRLVQALFPGEHLP